MNNSWFRGFTAPTGDRPLLVCFPHAGGTAAAYIPLARALSAEFDVVSVQYPGRQDRYAESPFTTLAPLVAAVAAELAHEVARDRGRPYALFGHSMGALVAFETARLLIQNGLPAPQRLFLSARGGALCHTGVEGEPWDNADVLADVHRLGGTDQAMLDDPHILEMVLPALRADYRAVATYRWDRGEPITVPVTALIGDQDPLVTVQEARTWGEYTSGDFELRVFRGGHFYLTDRIGQVAAAIREGLLAGTAVA
ncbi:alpha/beta fold hydrolase [Streptomyces sp. NPDC005963]|uniref:thioesterase II family protein n=1 Tax=Streptomyces sp. NPDC005963 TaxID=3156721 RepID=UPI0033CEE9DF